MDRQTIIIYFPTFCKGGMEKNAVYAANLYAESGYNVIFAYCRHDGGQFNQLSSEVSKLKIGGWLKLPLCNRHVLDALSSFLSLIMLLLRRRAKSTVVFSFQSNIMAILATTLTRRRCIARISSHPSAARSKTGWLMPKISEKLKRVFYRFASIVITNSQENSECYTKLLNRQVQTIYNPLVSSAASTNDDTPIHEWLKNKDLPVIVSAGRFSVEKGYPTLIKAFAKASQSTPCRLIIFGNGLLRSQLENLISELGINDRVSLPGFVSNLSEQFSHADLFVLSSLYEGLPNALIEALAAGCPAISTLCHSGPTEILLSGEGGDLVPIGESEQMAQAISKYISDPDYAKAKLSKAQTELGRFSEESVKTSLLDLMQKAFNL